MPAPDSVLQLIEKFESNKRYYESTNYNEAQTRIDFIDPFFIALEWDVYNTKDGGKYESYKDVVVEDSVRVGKSMKAPDYSFRLGGQRVFFVEAKSPNQNLVNNSHHAHQVRSYGWSAKLPISILTDFKELAIYDCRIKPVEGDSPGAARIKFFTCSEYVDRWDEIHNLVARTAVEKGSLQKYLDTGNLKGTVPVDEDFLTRIEHWRDNLAHNIALRNTDLDSHQLNDAVQRTIDRIVFLRIAEDRGIEVNTPLQPLLNGANVWNRLREYFYYADDKYNSGLFLFDQSDSAMHRSKATGRSDPDTITPNLAIDDKPLKEAIRDLYYPNPYKFDRMPTEILGQVYERFLEKVIRRQSRTRAIVEKKPELRKAGGVYYTPKYIVDYIVQQTVGRICNGKGPKEMAGIRVLDPACGSGSFLLGAYDFLLNAHLDWYVLHDAGHERKNDPFRKQRNGVPAVFQTANGDWKLTTSERRRILLSNIYGVDIDNQAVEVSRLSLLLKVMEGETAESVQIDLKFSGARALPDLNNNIKCGNSLIGSDFYTGSQFEMLTQEENRRINVFDWETEFPEIMKTGGFDAVIGNPPYVRVRIFKSIFPEQVDYLIRSYACATHVWDIYLLMFERSLQLINKNGRVSFILPIQTLHQPNCMSLREMILSKYKVENVVDLSYFAVFKGPTVKNCILTVSRNRNNDSLMVMVPQKPGELADANSWQWSHEKAERNDGFSLKTDLLSSRMILCDKLRAKSILLEDAFYATFGMRSSAKGVGRGGKERLITRDPKEQSAKPYLEGRDINRFSTTNTGNFIRYTPSEMYSPRSPELFERPKIVSRSMLSNKQLVATLDLANYYVEQSLVCIIPHGTMTPDTKHENISLEFLLGILNSSVQTFYFSTKIIDFSLGGGLIHATPGSHGKLLIPIVNKSVMERVTALVNRMLSLHTQLAAARTNFEQTNVRRQISSTDQKIDRLVYELYGLTEEEIKIVEGR